MKREILRRVSVATTLEAEDAVAELLSVILGQPATSYYDIESGLSTITAYLQRRPRTPRQVREEIRVGLKRIRSCGLKIGPGKIAITKVRRENWAESWKRHFKPIEIGDALLIKPSWSKRRARKDQAAVVLDPGLSFGTGQHPTTAFCLHQIAAAVCDRRNRRSQSAVKAPSFLDLGTGSGILAIAAAKLGYSRVTALDFDSEAVRVARANARANRVYKKLTIRHGDVAKLPIRPRQSRQRYDLVCANLTSNLLIAERHRIMAQLNSSGTLVLAGILKSEFTRAQKAFEALGLKLATSRGEEEWRSGSFRFAH